jgi:integrase
MQALIGADLVKQTKPAEKPFEIRDTRLKGFLMRVQPSGTMTFYVELERGKRYRIGPVDAVKPEAARQRAKEMLSRTALGEDVLAENREAKAHSLGSFIAEIYKPWAEGTMKSAAETIRSLTVSFAEFQNKKLESITSWHIEKWRAARLKAGARPSSVNRELDNIRALFSKAVEWKHVKGNPVTGVKRSKIDRAAPVRFLSEAEEGALLIALDDRETRIKAERAGANKWRAERGYPLYRDLRACKFADHLRPIVILSMHTGMRRGEVFSLDWRDIDLDRALITIRGENAKSKATRHLPLNSAALSALKGWREQSSGDGLVFPSTNGGKLDNLRKAWLTVLGAAGIKNFRWHDMRHHFASRLVMAGVDLNTVRELLGHSNITMTLRYSHLAPEHRAAAVARLVTP